MAVNEAELRGIDLDALFAESPSHPSQLWEREKWEKAAEVYWETRRLLEPPKEPQAVTEPPKPAKRVAKKRVHKVPKVTKGRRLEHYEFSDRQLQIALGVLNARHNV